MIVKFTSLNADWASARFLIVYFGPRKRNKTKTKEEHERKCEGAVNINNRSCNRENVPDRWDALWCVGVSVLVYFRVCGHSVAFYQAKAESIGSILKYFSKACSNSGTSAIIEKTIVKDAGVCGDGNDDEFILSCWGMFFGSGKPDTFKFNKTRPSKPYQRGQRSVALARSVKKISLKRYWTPGLCSHSMRVAASIVPVARPSSAHAQRVQSGLGVNRWRGAILHGRAASMHADNAR